jgi:hypothetical protein
VIGLNPRQGLSETSSKVAGKGTEKQVENVSDIDDEAEEENSAKATNVGDSQDKEGSEDQPNEGGSGEIEDGGEKNDENDIGSQHQVSDHLNPFLFFFPLNGAVRVEIKD